MSLTDAHLHLQDPAFAPYISAVLQQAQSVGVTRFISNGTSESDWPRLLTLARAHPQILPCFGLHPWFVEQRSPDWLAILESHLDAIPSAVGEIGLDKWIEPRDESAQEEVFCAQLALAKRKNLPVMIHCLRAWDWLMKILRAQGPPPAGFLLHAYGGPVELIRPLTQMGAYFSFAGNVLDPKRTRARESLAAVPLDRLLVETDAPDMLPPEPFRPYMLPATKLLNHPANLPAILQGISFILQKSEQELIPLLHENARRFLAPLPIRI